MRTEICAMKVKQSVLYTHKNLIQDSYFRGCEECVVKKPQ